MGIPGRVNSKGSNPLENPCASFPWAVAKYEFSWWIPTAWMYLPNTFDVYSPATPISLRETTASATLLGIMEFLFKK